jgi:hypothetical protein
MSLGDRIIKRGTRKRGIKEKERFREYCIEVRRVK